jgi:cytochrome c-type biogenesis protein CcmH/NrfF
MIARLRELEKGLRELAGIGENVTDEVGTLANDLANKSCKHLNDGHCVDCIVTYLVDSLTGPFILKINKLLERPSDE